MNTTESTQLTVNDLAAIKEIINLACTRGAFRGNEMRTVGTVYDKIVAFLDEVVSQSQSDETPVDNDQETENSTEGETQ